MKVIALSGFKKSGKDVAADYLVKHFGFRREAFADILKDMVAEEYGVSREHMDDPRLKEAPIYHLPVSPKDEFALFLSKMLFKEFRTENNTQPLDYHIDASGTFLGLIGRTSMPRQLYWTPRALCILKGSTNRTVASNYWTQRTIDNINKDMTSTDVTNPDNYYVISDLRYKNEMSQLREAFGKDLITVRINRFDSVNSDDPSENDLTGEQFDVIIDNKEDMESYISKLRDFATDLRK